MIYIGTSGWHYPHWTNNFYPDSLSKKKFLNYYSSFLRSVEINSSFYRLPKKNIFERWKNQVSNDFIFSVKVNRYVTHVKKLNVPKESLNLFWDSINVIYKNLGAILFQLPPFLSFNKERFTSFLNILPTNYKYAFEFRNKSWHNPEVYALLYEYRAAYCIFELAGWKSPKIITAPFVYIRLHGPFAAYKGSYSREILNEWLKEILKWHEEGKDIYCYFDNDEYGYAVHNAMSLWNEIRGGLNGFF